MLPAPGACLRTFRKFAGFAQPSRDDLVQGNQSAARLPRSISSVLNECDRFLMLQITVQAEPLAGDVHFGSKEERLRMNYCRFCACQLFVIPIMVSLNIVYKCRLRRWLYLLAAGTIGLISRLVREKISTALKVDLGWSSTV